MKVLLLLIILHLMDAQWFRLSLVAGGLVLITGIGGLVWFSRKKRRKLADKSVESDASEPEPEVAPAGIVVTVQDELEGGLTAEAADAELQTEAADAAHPQREDTSQAPSAGPLPETGRPLSAIVEKNDNNYSEKRLDENIALIFKSLAQIEERLSHLPRATAKVSSFAHRIRSLEEKSSQVSARMNQLENYVQSELRASSEQAAKERQKEEELRAQENENARQESLRINREALHFRLRERLTNLSERSNLLKVSLLTDEIISTLKAESATSTQPENALLPYLEVSEQVRKLECKLDQFDELPQPYLDDKQQGIETEFDSFERSIDELDKAHRVIRFTNLLEEVRRHAGLQPKADQLRGLLNLELVDVVLGSTPHDLHDFEVVSAEGMGRQSVISEVLENGYRLKDGGAIVKKPKVKVRLEG